MTGGSSHARLLALLRDLLAEETSFGGVDAGDAAERIAGTVDAAIQGCDAPERAAACDLVLRFFTRLRQDGGLSRVLPCSEACRPDGGSGTVFSWSGRGCHYTKRQPFAASHAFRAGRILVRFEVARVERGISDRRRCTVLAEGDDAVRYIQKTRTLLVSFERRRLSPDEVTELGTRHVQKILNRLAEARILAMLPADVVSEIHGGSTRRRSILGRHLARFAARRSPDCYIHRDLAGDLESDLDGFLRDECLDLDLPDLDVGRQLQRARAARSIAKAAIGLLARNEETKRQLFEKKKFVLRTGYCITLDRVPEAFYPEILANADQARAWMALHGIDCRGADAAFLSAHPFLMVDTGLYPQSFADRLLATYDDIDGAIGGTIVHSESWQAIDLLEEHYRGQVNCCYIDPPYNTGGSTLGYDDRYTEAGWLTLLDERIRRSREFLRDDGLFFASIDDCEEENLKRLVKEVFGEENYLATIVWQRSYAPINLKKYFSEMQEYLLVSAKAKERAVIVPLPRNERQMADYRNPDGDPRGPWKPGNLTVGPVVGEQVYPITTPSGRTVLPPKGYCWRYTRARFEELRMKNRIWFGMDGDHAPTPKCFLSEVKDGVTPVTLWTYRDAGHYQTSMRELRDLMGDAVFVNPKPLALMDRILRISIGSRDTVLDLFAGSGSTAHAIVNLNRRDGGTRTYIAIEASDAFAATIRTRIQKACYASGWKDGRPRSADGISHAFKYIDLEQYEDALENLTEIGRNSSASAVPIRYVAGGAGAAPLVRLGTASFDRPFACTLRSVGGGAVHEEPVDLVETFSYLLGLAVKRIRTFSANGSLYRVVHGIARSGERTTAIWRTIPGLDLEADRQFIEDTILGDPAFAAGRVYINGSFRVGCARSIEPVFEDLMSP